ncbi:hypothetical protein [Streptomyces sp. NPDC101237]
MPAAAPPALGSPTLATAAAAGHTAARQVDDQDTLRRDLAAVARPQAET